MPCSSLNDILLYRSVKPDDVLVLFDVNKLVRYICTHKY